jgi:hypothetical protein
MSRITALIAASSLAALPFIATASPEAETKSIADTCAISSQFSRIMNLTQDGATIETLPGKQFQVSFSSPCLGANGGFTVALQPRAQASLCIERGDALHFEAQGIRYVCRIQTIEPLAKKQTPS